MEPREHVPFGASRTLGCVRNLQGSTVEQERARHPEFQAPRFPVQGKIAKRAHYAALLRDEWRVACDVDGFGLGDCP